MSAKRYGAARPGLPPGACATCGGHGHVFEAVPSADGLRCKRVGCDDCAGTGGSSPSAVAAERKRFEATRERVREVTAAAWARLEALRAGGGE